MPYQSELQKPMILQREEKLLELQVQGLIKDCIRPNKTQRKLGILPECKIKNYPSEPTKKVCPPCRKHSQRSSAYTSFLAKIGKEKIRNEIYEDTIKVLENKNIELADANRQQEEEIRKQSLQLEHYQRQLQNYQHQLEECRSSLNRAMFCYEMEYENNQLYKDLLQVPPNTFL